MTPLPANERSGWLDRFESKWGIRNVKYLEPRKPCDCRICARGE